MSVKSVKTAFSGVFHGFCAPLGAFCALFVSLSLAPARLEGFIKDWVMLGPFPYEQTEDPFSMNFIENEPSLYFADGSVIAGK